jgi:hypothetical protein
MTIGDDFIHNFETLLRAAKNKDLALMQCTNKLTNAPVIVICAVMQTNDEYQFVPLAKLFEGDPYEELDPPDPDAAPYPH